jgi:hypothetical protein
MSCEGRNHFIRFLLLYLEVEFCKIRKSGTDFKKEEARKTNRKTGLNNPAIRRII